MKFPPCQIHKIFYRFTLLATTFSLSVAGVAVEPQLLERGWKPSVELTGEGDSQKAVDKMREMAELQEVILNNTEFHEQTQEFVDGLWASFERFDLNRFYKLLPEEQGEWRQLSVIGRREGSQYHLGPQSFEGKNLVEMGFTPSAMGDFYAEVRAKEIARKRLNSNYLLQADFSWGVGSVDWEAVTNATEETFRIVVDGDPRFTKKLTTESELSVYRQRVEQMNPSLGDEDIEIIAPLWAAFPQMWDLLAKLARVEDVVVSEVAGTTDYKKLQASLSIQPKKMKKLYPKLSRFLTRMKSLLHFNIDLMNDDGRYFNATIDTDTLTLAFEAFIKEGQVLPVNAVGQVVTDVKPREPGQPLVLDAIVDARVEVFGVVTTMDHMKTQLSYITMEDGASFETRMNEMPEIAIKGSVFGIMPTAFIDVFIPGNLLSLMEEFMSTATEGNNGEGIVVDLNYADGKDNKVATMNAEVSFEGLNNRLISFGMGIVNDLIIPNDDVSDEIRALMADTQEAFKHDLEGFAGVVSL